MRDRDHRSGRREDESLQLFEAGKVQVVCGLVEEQNIETAQQDRGECSPCELTAAQSRHLNIEPVGQHADVGADLTHACVEVGATEREKVVERVRILVHQRWIGGEPLRPVVERVAGFLYPRATSQVRGERLTGAAIRFLGQQADGRARRDPFHASGIREFSAGQDPEQRRLADPVRADNPHPLAGGDAQRDVVEDDGTTERYGDRASREHGS